MYHDKEALSMQQGFVKTNDGAYIYYEVEGDGRPIVFVHGWSAS